MSFDFRWELLQIQELWSGLFEARVKVYTFNEGGKHLTIGYVPAKKWLRIYILGFVFTWGNP